jgi:hypothetical protein
VAPNIHSNLSAPTVSRFSAIFKVLEVLQCYNVFEDEGITLNVGNRLPEEEEPHLGPRHKWKGNIKKYLKKRCGK